MQLSETLKKYVTNEFVYPFFWNNINQFVFHIALYNDFVDTRH